MTTYRARLSTVVGNVAARFGLADELGGVLARGVVAALAVRVAGMASGLVLYLVLARLLAPQGFGRYALALSWVNVLAMVATLGTDNAALRFIAQYRASGDWSRVRGYQRLVARLGWMVGVTIAVLASAVALRVVEVDAQWTFVAVFAAIPFIAQIAQRQAVLRAYGSVVSALVPEQVVRPLLMVSLLVGVAILRPPLTPLAAALCLLLATLMSFALGRRLLQRRQPAMVASATSAIEPRFWLATALRLGMLTWAYALLRQMDLLMVGALSPIRDAGVYAVATRCADIAIFVSLAIDAILAPLIARLHAQGDRARLGLLVRRAVRVALLLSAPTCIVLWLAGDWVLSWFGAAYQIGYAPFAILVGVQLLGVTCGYGSYLLTMTGREAEALLVLLAALGVDALANLVLIPLYGNVGAACATLLAALVWRFGCVALAWWRVGINPLPFGPMVR